MFCDTYNERFKYMQYDKVKRVHMKNDTAFDTMLQIIIIAI